MHAGIFSLLYSQSLAEYAGPNRGVCSSSLVGHLQNLKALKLNLAACYKLADVSALGEAIGHLQNLTTLKLNFRYCWQLRRELVKEFVSKAEFLAALST